jgi:hypothetical protein
VSPTYQAFDAHGDGIWTTSADTLPEALAETDESNTTRTKLDAVKMNDGYVENVDTGEEVYAAEDDDD